MGKSRPSQRWRSDPSLCPPSWGRPGGRPGKGKGCGTGAAISAFICTISLGGPAPPLSAEAAAAAATAREARKVVRIGGRAGSERGASRGPGEGTPGSRWPGLRPGPARPGRVGESRLTSQRRRRAEVPARPPATYSYGPWRSGSPAGTGGCGVSRGGSRGGSAGPAHPPRAARAAYRPRAGLVGETRGPGRGAISAPSVPGGKARPEKAGGGCRKSEPPLRGRPLKGRQSAAMAGETRGLRPRPRPPASPGPAAAATAIVERRPPLSPLLTSRHAF